MRLFIAVPFPPEIRRVLSQAQRALAAFGTGNFTRPENLHLTLAFLGETERLAQAKAALDRLPLPEMTLTLRDLGRFDTLYWAGVDGGTALFSMQRTLCRLLAAEGFALESRRFTPHVTLCRQFRPHVKVDLTRVKAALGEATFPLERLSLFSSERASGRLFYLPRHTVFLRGN